MKLDAGLAVVPRSPGRLGYFPGAAVLLAVVAAAWAQTAPPAAGQGTVSPSGKFSLAPGLGTHGAGIATPFEAEAALKKGLNVRQTGSNTFQIGRVEFNKLQRTVTVPARVNLRTQIVEYALVTEQGKAYESMLTTQASPADVHLAFLLLGVSPAVLSGDFRQPLHVPETNAVGIEVGWETNGKTLRAALSELLSLTNERAEPQSSMSVTQWFYNGSVFQGSGFAAQQEGSIISVIRDPSALVNNPAADCDNDKIHLPNAQRLPAEGSPVRVIFNLLCPGRGGLNR